MANEQILIVDDEPLYVNFIRNVLPDLGYGIFGTASSGKEAVKKVSKSCPDLILMDVTLEDEMDGINTAQMILERFDVPIIYLTAHTDSTTLTRAKITGPYGYIRKPFNEEDLHINIEMALYKHKMGLKLKSAEEQYRTLFEQSPNAIILIDPDTTLPIKFNSLALELLCYTSDEFLKLPISKYVANENPEEIKSHMETVLLEGKSVFETRMRTKYGDIKDVIVNVRVINFSGKPVFHSIINDVTERKKAEKLLPEQQKSLRQKNIALSELLGQIELEKQQIKDNVVANAENLLLPIVQRLKLSEKSSKYVQLLQKNIQELASSFGSKLIKDEAKLTSREIEICNMIKNGLTSKEIAGLLNITLGTAGRHRNNIRKKLGIINEECNLASFLHMF